jgi:hypothetical protein
VKFSCSISGICGHALDRLAHQVGQQIRADRVDHAEAERPGQRVLAALRDLLDAGGLLDHRLRLPDDLVAERRHADLVRAALEDAHAELFLELLDRHAQGRLRDEAGLGRPAEVLLAGHGDDVAEFGQGHAGLGAGILTCIRLRAMVSIPCRGSAGWLARRLVATLAYTALAYAVRCSCRPSASTIALRISNFCALPVAVSGNASTMRT